MALANLAAEVAEIRGTVESAVAFINGLKQQLTDALAANDPAAIQALVDELDSTGAALAAAITAEPPAEEEPAPEGE